MSRSTRCRRSGPLVGLLALAGVIAATAAPAGAVLPSLTLTSSQATVTDGDIIDLTASLPVTSDTGSITDEIIQKIDPTKTRLHSIEDVIAPAEWTVSYSYDGGTTWTTNEPATETGTATSWDKVSAVKAAGTIRSGGSSSGKQVMTGSASYSTPPSAAFVNPGGGGDGWAPFFDNDNHVFNVYHHTAFRLACATRIGGSCGNGWTFAPSTEFVTGMSSYGTVDNVNRHVWVGVFTTTGSSYRQSSGFVCVDIRNMNAPKLCGGSAAAAYRRLGPGVTYNFPGPVGPVVIGTRIYQWDQSGVLTCLDMSADDGDGAACPGQPYTIGSIRYAGLSYNWPQTAAWQGTLLALDGKVYGSGAASVPFGYPNGIGTAVPVMHAMCWDPATNAVCAGWETLKTLPAGEYIGYAYVLPDSSGVPRGVCYQVIDLVAGHNATCFTPDGTSLAQNSTFARSIVSTAFNATYVSNGPTTVGKRIYWTGGEGVYWAAAGKRNKINCFDVSTNANCTGGWPITAATHGDKAQAYTVIVDPQNPACIWKNDDRNNIVAFNAYDTSTATCGSLVDAEFEARVLVPRLACSATTAIESWKELTLTSPVPAGYGTATLVVVDSDGSRLAGWTEVSPSGTDGSGNPVFDLSSLSVSDTGQTPTFIVSLVGRTSNDPANVTLSAIGGAPQLCLTPHVVTPCQSAPGPLLPTVWTQTVTAKATVQVGSGSVDTLDDATTELTAMAPPTSECGALLRGTTATMNGDVVPNARVDLLDEDGEPVLSGGLPVFTLSDSNGNYVFDLLAAGQYRVKFRSEIGNDIHKASTQGGARGTDWGTTLAHGTELKSLMVRLEPGDTGDIDGVYVSLTLPATGTDPTIVVMVGLSLLFFGFGVRRLRRA